MNWNALLTTKKLVSEESEPDVFFKYPINEFEKDYNRIVSSAAFRRLQDKTQVFPLDKSDFVRTRLTHSIEVSTIARQLGIMITKNISQYRSSEMDQNNIEDIPSVLLCAGLLHDLGNPPFGHFGETVIGDWFKENLGTITYKGIPLKKHLAPQMISDLENFEGNAQALRILLKAKYNSEINLSQAIISTLVKYPTDSLSFNQAHPEIKCHKLGFYASEEAEFIHTSRIVDTLKTNGNICRHPLTFLLEAADDIAYATADLEDAFRKNLFTLDNFILFFQKSYDPRKIISQRSPEYYSDLLLQELCALRGSNPTVEQDNKAFNTWLNHTRRWLMYVAVYCFSNRYNDIMSGIYNHDLFFNTNHSLTIKILKKAMKEFAFDSPGILKLELSAQTILSFLLEKFVHAILYFDYSDPDKGFIPSKADAKYISLLSDNYKQDYQNAHTGNENFDLYLRLLMVTDYISGMTDSYAKTLYRELCGIE